MKPALPLCVDLDGTLLATDCLWESFIQGIKKNPFIVFLVPFWIFRGKAFLKNRLAGKVEFDVESLPENPRFLNWLAGQVAIERDIYLVSASNQKLVSAVAAKFGLFKEAIGSSAEHNLRGRHKAKYLADRFGEGGFDYAGNDFPDLKIWEKCHSTILVNPAPRLLKRVPDENRLVIIEDRPGIARAFIKAMRPHQWVKNFLIFVPLLTAHIWRNADAWSSALLAFVSFCLSASAVYLVNDLTDLNSDRRHITKRNRPFASGSLPLYYGLAAVPVLLVASFLLMVFANPVGLPMLAVYLVATCLYSFWLKRVAGVDIILLAGLYTLRLLLGGAVVSVEISQWLLAFAMFFFLSLALAKRFSELFNIKDKSGLQVAGRGYYAADQNIVAMMGSSSGYLSVLVLALYVSSDHVSNLYEKPQWIWLSCPIMLIWITRLWLVTYRGDMDEDPIHFAIRDAFSYATVLTMGLISILAAPI